MKKAILILLCVVFVCAAAAGCTPQAQTSSSAPASSGASSSQTASASSSGSAQTPEEVVFVITACITGNNAESGRQCLFGAQYAVDYVNDNGGIKALGGAKIRLEVCDSTSDSNNSALALQRALDANPDTVAICGNSTSSMTLAMLEVLQKYQIPALCTTASNSTITEKGCEFIFQPGSDAQQFAGIQVEAVKYFFQKKNMPESDIKVGIVFENSAWGQDNAKGAKKRCEDAGFAVGVEETYPVEGFTDAGPMVTKLKNAGVNVLMPASYVNDTKLIMSTMQAMDFHPLIVGGGAAFAWPSFGKELGSIGNGVLSSCNWTWDMAYSIGDEVWADMMEDFENRWMPEVKKLDGEKMGEQTGPACLNVLMWAEAMDETGSSDPIVLRDYMFTMTGENSRWFKMIHPNSVFNKNGKNTGDMPTIGQWQDGIFHCVLPEDLRGSNIFYDPFTMQPLE